MNFGGVTTHKNIQPGWKRRRIDNLIALVEEEKQLYENVLSFYDIPPNCTISFEDFEKYALARLKVLRLIERINLTSNVKFSNEWKLAIFEDMKKQNLVEFEELFRTAAVNKKEIDDDQILFCRRFDHISHFLLRLAFARTEEQRKWLISLELDFFRLKTLSCMDINVQHFLVAHKFPGIKLDDKEKNNLKAEILAGTFGLPNLATVDIFKVPFIFALALVRQRRVFLKDGFAYVPFTELVSVACTAFRSYLSESITIVKKRMHLVEQDTRIIQLIQDFDQRHTGNVFVPKKEGSTAITAEELPILSQKSFPLCMRSLYDVVVKESHLKHFGRLQLGLFLKGIGVPMEEATKFWRSHFTKKPEIDGQRFDKQYLYNIRHMYGQEGKRADYTPYSCMKVITSSVGAGDHHGCPFKHSDQPNLRLKLTNALIPQKGIKEILDLIEGHHYQIACQKYFEWTHDKMTVDGGVNHPNQYFEESRAVLGGKKTIKTEEKGPKTTRTLIYSDGSSSQQIKKEEKIEMSEETAEDDEVQMEVDENIEVDRIISELDF